MRTLLDRENLIFKPPPMGCVMSLTGLPGGSNKIYDRSPYGNNGTITGATWVRLASGLWCLSFDGSDDGVNCGQAASLNITEQLTYELWLRPGTTWQSNGDYAIMWKGEKVFVTYGWPTATGINVLLADLSTYVQSQGLSLVAGTWYHLVITLKSGTDDHHIFLNGRDVANETATKTIADSSADSLRIGEKYDGWGFSCWDGQIARPRVYRQALTAMGTRHHFHREKRLFGVW
jgi:hypothetical protein